jgi:hypothetical protein
MKNKFILLLSILSPQLIVAQNANIPDLDGVYQINHVDEELPLNTRAAFTQVANFPVFLDSFVSIPKGGPIYCNMDADVEKEIVFGVGQKLFAKNLDGTDVTGWPVFFPTNFEVNNTPSYGDIDGDNKGEVVVTIAGGSSGFIYAYKQNGSLASGFPVTLGRAPLLPVLADLDSNGTMEIIVGKYISSTVGEMQVYNGNGSMYSGWPVQLGEWPGSSVAVGDINGDGSKEIVGESRNSIWVWDKDGNVLPGFPFDIDTANVIITSYSAPILVDIDNNGSKEIVFGAHNPGGVVYVVKNDGTLYPGWPQTTPNWIYGAPIAADIDNDGMMEIIIGDQIASTIPSSYLYFFEHDGTVKHIVGPIDAINNQVTVADIDNDGKYEFMVDVNTQKTVTGRYNAYDDDFSQMSGWPLSTQGNTYFSQLIIGDLNNNGNFDLVGAGGDLNTFYMYLNHWNSTNPVNSMVINPHYQLNTFHDGYYENEVFPVSINENNYELSVSIYPNPFINEVKIVSKNIKSVTISSLNGQVVFNQQQVKKNQITLNFNSLKKGVYFAVIKNEHGLVVTKKIVKL